MSGKTLLDQIDDLSEDDGDFVPVAKPKRRRSSSGSSSSGSSNDDTNPNKKIKTAEEEKAAKEAADEAQKRKEVQRKRDLKSIFDVEEEARAEREAGLVGRVVEDGLVEIKRPRLFAGKTIYETVKLPKTHPDVLKYGPAISTSQVSEHPPQPDKPDASSTAAILPALSTLPTEPLSPKLPTTAPTASTTVSASDPQPPKPKPKPPLRRKPRQSLESMNAALVAAKGKKMSTIEKSSQDWRAHTTQNTDLAAELAANRRENGGGFLEKREFLGRVEERRDGLLEGTKRGRR